MPKSAARRRVPAVPASETPDVLAILLKQGVLDEEQAERVRRAQKINGYPAEQAMVQLGLVNEVQIAPVVDLAPEVSDPVVDVGHPKGGRSHVHSSATRAEVQRHTDQRHALRSHARPDASTPGASHST